MALVDDNYPKKAAEEMSDAALKAAALQNFKQEEVKKYNFPTEIVDLPTRGLLYSGDNPLASGKVEMKYMTAREEDILTSANLIKQGVVLDKLFQSMIVSKINYDDLLVCDKNAIMIAARVLGYGKDYAVEVQDPFSENKQKVVIDLTTIGPKEYDYESISDGQNEFTFVLPASKRTITFRLLTHGLEKKIKEDLKGYAKLTKNTGIDKELTTRLKNLITSVDGKTDTVTINNFVDNELLAMDSRALRDQIKKVTPDLDMTFVFTSETTGETKVMDMPMDVSFFWPNS
jgi:hypothetical protein